MYLPHLCGLTMPIVKLIRRYWKCENCEGQQRYYYKSRSCECIVCHKIYKGKYCRLALARHLGSCMKKHNFGAVKRRKRNSARPIEPPAEPPTGQKSICPPQPQPASIEPTNDKIHHIQQESENDKDDVKENDHKVGDKEEVAAQEDDKVKEDDDDYVNPEDIVEYRLRQFVNYVCISYNKARI